MNNPKNPDNLCRRFREWFEPGAKQNSSLSFEEKGELAAHPASCRSCAEWKVQTESLVELAGAMPKFDVSESLTQRILSSVSKESSPGLAPGKLPAGPLCIMAAAAVVLLLPAEGWQGVLSWLTGLLGLGLLQILVKSASSGEVLG